MEELQSEGDSGSEQQGQHLKARKTPQKLQVIWKAWSDHQADKVKDF